jgi:two-component system response regulator WspF
MAADGEEAIQKAERDRPDAILMDLVMPVANGVVATQKIMKATPCPILVVTATIPGNYDLVMQAMGAGALDAVETPTAGPGGKVAHEASLLNRLAKIASAAKGMTGSRLVVPHRRTIAIGDYPPLVVIGSSTGGPQALERVLSSIPANIPAAVLIAQHICSDFAPGLATWLGARSALPVRCAQDDDTPRVGTVLVAATNDHLELTAELKLRYTPTPENYPYRPSVDVLFSSCTAWPRPGIGVLLTGMGADGAEGLLQLRALGWHTIAQDQTTSIVYGMPKAAAERGAASEILPLCHIGPAIVARLMSKPVG